MLLPALLRQLRYEAAAVATTTPGRLSRGCLAQLQSSSTSGACSIAVPAAPSALARVQQQLSCSSLASLERPFSLSSLSAAASSFSRTISTSSTSSSTGVAAAAAAAAVAAAPADALPPPPPPPPDHLGSRRRGYMPPPPGLGRRTRGLVARYPFRIDYGAPKPVFVYDLDGRVLARRELPGDVFNVPVRLDILHRVVRWQRAKAQQGTHKAKDRSEVSGGGRKPWQQKGTGRARQGSIRAPQWRGGGAAHGPVPRSHAHKLPKKVRRLGLKCALSAKAHEGRLLLLDSLKPPGGDAPKTRELARRLDALLAGRGRRSALLIDSAKDGADGGAALRRAGGNISGVEIVPACGANVYSILRRDVLVMTSAAADALAAHLRSPVNRLGATGRAYAARMARLRAAREAAGGVDGAADSVGGESWP